MFLKRAGWSLWRHKFRNILVLLVFSAILAVTLTSFMIYAGTSHQVEVTQKAVANALTLTGPTINGIGASAVIDIDWSAADMFVRSPHVERYNIVMTNVEMEAADMMPAGLAGHDQELYEKYQAKLKEYGMDFLLEAGKWEDNASFQMIHFRNPKFKDENPGYRYEETYNGETGMYEYDIYDPTYTEEENAAFLDAWNAMRRVVDGEYVPQGLTITAVSDSEFFDSFSSGGYNLVEGRHFKSEEEDKNYVILSRETAEENGLQVGDTIELSFSLSTQSWATFYKNDTWQVEILGLFDPPQNDILGDIGYQTAARNYMFVPYQAMMNYLRYLYNDDTLLWFPRINRATVYIDEPENVEDFLDDTYRRFKVVEKDISTGKLTGTSIEDVLNEDVFGSGDPDVVEAKFIKYMMDSFSSDPWFTLLVDRGWYDMVAMPMESLNSLSLFMGVGLLIGAFVVLLLVCVFNVRSRKREVGVLLSMGESRAKVFAQMFIEQALPLVLAAAIGFGAGAPLATALGSSLLEDRSSQVNAAYEQDKREYLETQLNGNAMSLENSLTMRSAANVASPVAMQFKLDPGLAWGYFGLAFAMLFLTVLIQMAFLLRLSPAKIMTRRN
ncbi:MAG: FtsX-like permease family protein [Acutalibacter sp.]|nr:FtsX-like permease family protein [Acutalibacter sp.]